MLDLSLWADGLLLTGECSEHQRVSVISNASSNTTSGIVSDRVYSLDGSEGSLQQTTFYCFLFCSLQYFYAVHCVKL